jgi:hypothetical protein
MFVDKDILWFNVPVNDSFLVQVFECKEDLMEISLVVFGILFVDVSG